MSEYMRTMEESLDSIADALWKIVELLKQEDPND